MSDTKFRILHVDDDLDMRKYVKVILGNIASISAAESLTAAKKALSLNNYDLILLDLTLPDGSGLDVITYLSDVQKNTPIVVFSAHEVTNNLLNVEQVLVKGRFNEKDLIATVQRLCGN